MYSRSNRGFSLKAAAAEVDDHETELKTVLKE